MTDPPQLALKPPGRILSALKMHSVTSLDYSKENKFFKYFEMKNAKFFNGHSGHTGHFEGAQNPCWRLEGKLRRVRHTFLH